MGHRILDAQNELDAAVAAFDGLRDLFNEPGLTGSDSFETLRPQGVAALISMVGDRFLCARKALDEAADEVFGR